VLCLCSAGILQHSGREGKEALLTRGTFDECPRGARVSAFFRRFVCPAMTSFGFPVEFRGVLGVCQKALTSITLL
jgi:hypothetical protein